MMCNARKWKVKDKVEWGSTNESAHAPSSRLGHESVQQSLNDVCVGCVTISCRSCPCYIFAT